LRPKFSPSQEIALLFMVEFRALRTVDPVRWSARYASPAEIGKFRARVAAESAGKSWRGEKKRVGPEFRRSELFDSGVSDNFCVDP
jgi:hypothetical protein